MRLSRFFPILLAALLANFPVLAQDQQIGAVSLRPYLGAVGERVTGGREQLYFNTSVWTQQTVRTPENGQTTLRLLDDTLVQVGGDSELLLDRFLYDPNRHVGDMAVSFGSGIFRFVSGEMQNKEGYRLNTPVAQLAVRGTEFILLLGGSPFFTLAVVEGAVEVRPNAGGPPALVQAGQFAVLGGGIARPSVADGHGGLLRHERLGDSDSGLHGADGEGSDSGSGGY